MIKSVRPQASVTRQAEVDMLPGVMVYVDSKHQGKTCFSHTDAHWLVCETTSIMSTQNIILWGGNFV